MEAGRGGNNMRLVKRKKQRQKGRDEEDETYCTHQSYKRSLCDCVYETIHFD
jgi:hypothetical protein